MVTQEMVQAEMLELQRKAAEAQREQQARQAAGRAGTPRSGLSLPIVGSLPLPPFLARTFPASPAS